IHSGKAIYTEGPYTRNHLSRQENYLSDPDLEDIINASGQELEVTDVAFFQFDFVSPFNNLSFNFIFASNEYGQWQCYANDGFAFLLTNLNTGETVNLAVVPDTDTPISVTTVRDEAYNQTCTSNNAAYFGQYNVGNPGNSTINMRGRTTVLKSSAPIEPETPYRLRLVI